METSALIMKYSITSFFGGKSLINDKQEFLHEIILWEKNTLIINFNICIQIKISQ